MQCAKIFFAERHPAAGRADHGEFRLKTGGLRERFTHRADHHLGGAMQPAALATIAAHVVQPFVGNLSRSLATTLLNREPLDRRNAVAPKAERLRSFFQAEAERTNDSR